MFQNFLDNVLIPAAGDLLLVVITFFVGQIVIRVILGILNRLLRNAHRDEIFIEFAHRVTNILLQILLLSLLLGILGINPAYLFALLGAIGLALVLAFQESLQNFAGGILLFLLTPFHKGDELEFEKYKANVKEIGIYSTKLTTKDNREVIIPNAVFLSDVIVNNSTNPIRRIDLIIRVDYEADLMTVRNILTSLMSEDPRILNEPEPRISISDLAESSVNLKVRPWVLTEDHSAVGDDLKERIKLAFEKQGIQIPYPRLDINALVER